MNYEKILRECASSLNIELSDEQVLKLLRYVSEIELFNKKYKLVGAKDEEIITKHIMDSLSAVKEIEKHISDDSIICDVGSGAGLPGIPLAIYFENNKFALIERMSRRVNFLNNAIIALRLNNRVEIIPKDLKDVDKKFDLVTFRAFHPLFDIVDEIDNITHKDSIICAYKARLDSVVAEKDMVDSECSSKWEFEYVNLDIPFIDAPRMLCLL
ncbi:MAG: 16S rRNA (guanine(527)-N(7))-methyltransferase RsmG, partial [Sphaerochaetaceae bacterium]|nr:16S rRNA (guanine(527)-N(7))-methyltransferase RsmG [Sphaerochaetaceae bacterium]